MSKSAKAKTKCNLGSVVVGCHVIGLPNVVAYISMLVLSSLIFQGYGDLHMPFELRLFQALYTTLGAVLVGGVIGGARSLKQDLETLKTKFAWKQLEVSKRLVQEMKGSMDPEDLKIDEYEFMIGSLLVLQKADVEDVEAIMSKFRELSKGKDYIMCGETPTTRRSSNLSSIPEPILEAKNEDEEEEEQESEADEGTVDC